mmetsp:Transcript_5380/g.16057  ORF Transcript_5380/g.16057 Transcript_5380/m.16057 type:complete len:752 (+) Transcript_5380:273-2528(+)
MGDTHERDSEEAHNASARRQTLPWLDLRAAERRDTSQLEQNLPSGLGTNRQERPWPQRSVSTHDGDVSTAGTAPWSTIDNRLQSRNAARVSRGSRLQTDPERYAQQNTPGLARPAGHDMPRQRSSGQVLIASPRTGSAQRPPPSPNLGSARNASTTTPPQQILRSEERAANPVSVTLTNVGQQDDNPREADDSRVRSRRRRPAGDFISQMWLIGEEVQRQRPQHLPTQIGVREMYQREHQLRESYPELHPASRMRMMGDPRQAGIVSHESGTMPAMMRRESDPSPRMPASPGTPVPLAAPATPNTPATPVTPAAHTQARNLEPPAVRMNRTVTTPESPSLAYRNHSRPQAPPALSRPGRLYGTAQPANMRQSLDLSQPVGLSRPPGLSQPVGPNWPPSRQSSASLNQPADTSQPARMNRAAGTNRPAEPSRPSGPGRPSGPSQRTEMGRTRDLNRPVAQPVNEPQGPRYHGPDAFVERGRVNRNAARPEPSNEAVLHRTLGAPEVNFATGGAHERNRAERRARHGEQQDDAVPTAITAVLERIHQRRRPNAPAAPSATPAVASRSRSRTTPAATHANTTRAAPSTRLMMARNTAAAGSSHAGNDSISLKRIEKDFSEVSKMSARGFYAGLRGDDSHEWSVIMEGPAHSPYKDGIFILDIDFPKNYPYQPPTLRFRSRIYHCNIGLDGNVHLPILRRWTPTCTIYKILCDLRKLLIEPNLQDPLMHSLAAEYEHEPERYRERAMSWTRRFAT